MLAYCLLVGLVAGYDFVFRKDVHDLFLRVGFDVEPTNYVLTIMVAVLYEISHHGGYSIGAFIGAGAGVRLGDSARSTASSSSRT